VGRCKKVKSEGGKGRERVVGKAAGNECVFIPGEVPGLADEVGFDALAKGPDAMPDAAGGEAVTGPLNRKG
jgi:hypothetical protein